MKPVGVFSVPIWKDTLPDFNNKKSAMLSDVLDFASKNKNEVKSNMYGYQSPKTLHLQSNLKFFTDFLNQKVVEAAESIGLKSNIEVQECWVNINNSRQCFNHQHSHGGVFSGVFFLSIPDGSGMLYLKNSCVNPMWDGLKITKGANPYTSEASFVPPMEGHLLIWPSYLEHSVGTNNHDEERISISFNAYVKE